MAVGETGAEDTGAPPEVRFTVDSAEVAVPDDGGSLLDVLREHLGIHSVKDGCSPQGQCGCCTVLVDGSPRVACVTPARRLAGRTITTVGGLDPEVREVWAEAFCSTGASQCGFCTPGIVLRLEGLRRKGVGDRLAVDRALAAHLCRCTGWQTVREAFDVVVGGPERGRRPVAGRDLVAAARRATIEGGTHQLVGPGVAVGDGGFADDSAPPDALVAVPDGRGGWVVGDTLASARAMAGKVQGRRTPLSSHPPLEVPSGAWDITLRTSWVEPAYLETDASWCVPGGEPASPLANGGAFGGKEASQLAVVARELADAHGKPVRVRFAREDCVRFGPKRPPIAVGMRSDGSGLLRVVRTPSIAERITRVAPMLVVEEVDVSGPPTSSAPRAAGWAEALVLVAVARAIASGQVGDAAGAVEIVTPNGAMAVAAVVAGSSGPRVSVRVSCGEVLDEVVLRSYCIGAAHMAISWVTSEALTVDDAGEVHDLTIRSFGVLPAAATPEIDVAIEQPSGGASEPVNGSDAVFAAVAAAVWLSQGLPDEWPTRRPLGGG